MTRRKWLEQVLRKYIRRLERTAVAEAKPVLSANIEDMLINDLLTCFPEPSREALEKLLMSWESRIIWNVDFQKGKSVIPERLDELMRWAAGEPEPPRWCSHMIWIDMKNDEYDRTTGWYGKDQAAFYSTKGFTVCPICAASRPTSGGG